MWSTGLCATPGEWWVVVASGGGVVAVCGSQRASDSSGVVDGVRIKVMIVELGNGDGSGSGSAVVVQRGGESCGAKTLLGMQSDFWNCLGLTAWA
jgi:hypothetical protein